MPIETLVVLKTEPRYLPLRWTALSMPLVAEYGALKAVCQLLMPDDGASRQRLFAAFAQGECLPCILKDPTRQRWYSFDAFVETYTARAAVEVTLRSHGEVSAADAVPPPRRRRRRPRRARAATVTHDKEASMGEQAHDKPEDHPEHHEAL